MKVCIHATVNDERGVHARPSAMIVKACRDYPGAVTVSRSEEPGSPEYDCKSIMSLVEMEASYMTKLRFCIDLSKDFDASDVDGAERRAKVLCDRLAAIVSMTLEDVEREWMGSSR